MLCSSVEHKKKILLFCGRCSDLLCSLGCLVSVCFYTCFEGLASRFRIASDNLATFFLFCGLVEAHLAQLVQSVLVALQ